MGCPRHVVRFEDIVSDPKTKLMDIMRFTLSAMDLEGTRAEKFVNIISDKILSGEIKYQDSKFKPMLSLFTKQMRNAHYF